MSKFVWSYTALSTFETCPYQFAAKYFYKTVKFAETEATIWGSRVHKCAENILKGIDPKDPEVEPLVMPYCKAMIKPDQKLLVEEKVAIRRDYTETEFLAKDVWGRGVIDVAIIRDDTCHIYDWKTGKVKDDPFQLKLFCLLMMSRSILLTKFTARFIWLKDGSVSKPVEMTKGQVVDFTGELLQKVDRVNQAWDNEIFTPRPSGLCKAWCDVMDCKHNGRK